MLSAIIVAAGSSRRMGFDKLFALLDGRPTVVYSLAAFERSASVSEIIIVTRADRAEEFASLVRSEDLRKVRHIVAGGLHRQDSVRAGLERLSPDAKFIAVHDAARPLITPSQIERVFEACRTHHAAALAEPVTDTLKRASADNSVCGSIDRKGAFAMQTPQIFEREALLNAYAAVARDQLTITDEVSALEHIGHKVILVPNDSPNFKVTHPADLPLAEFILRKRRST